MAALVEGVLAQLERPAPYHDQDDPAAPRRRARRPARSPAGIIRSSLPAAEQIRVEQWAAAYADLAVLFDTIENVLNGREILVDDAGTLRSANVQTFPRERRRQAKRVSAFLPPARDEAPVNVPASLRHHLFYLHPAVAEQLTTAVRSFLTGKGLIYGYDTRGLLEHVQGVLAGTESERIHRETLRFVFTLDQNGQIPRRPALNQLGLRVPTRGGTMLPAPRTAFGPRWPDRHGTDLVTVIDEAGDVDPDLAALGDRLVDPSPDLVRRGETTAQWAAFLARVGVVDGLPAFSPGPANPKVYGRQLGTDRMVRRFRLSHSIAEQWSDHLASSPQIRAAHPDTEYVAPHKPVWILGQAAAERLQPPARLAYARLIMYGLSHWPASYLETQWERDRPGNKDRQSIPTPLAAFVHEAEWVPAAPQAGGPAFARPEDLWHFPVGSDEAEPGFAALAARSVRGELDRQRAVLNALRAAGLSVWGEPEYAASLVRHLGEIAAKGAVTDGQWDQFLRAYLHAWSDVATAAGADLTSVDDLWLVLRRGVRLEASRVNDLAANGVCIYVAQPADGLHLRLLEELELPLLLVDGDLDRVRQELASGLGALVRVVDENAVAVAPSDLAEPGDLVADGLKWLVVLVAAAADHGRGLTMQDRPFDELALRLRNLRVRSYSALGLNLFDHPTALPTSRYGLLAQPDNDTPSVLAPALLSGLSGTGLVVLAEEMTVAVGRPDLQERVRAAVLGLLRSGGDHPYPGDDDIAEVLRLSVKQVESTRLRLSGGLDAIVRRLYPVLVYWVGQVAADGAADAARTVKGIPELTDALSMAGALPVDVEQLVATVRTATSLGELRAALALDFASFNQVLFTLAPEYAPISHQSEHEQALRGYLSLFRTTLIDQLRWSRLADFDGRRPQPDWPELRTFSWVTVPAEWGETVEKTSRPLLEELIGNAFARRLGTAAPITGPALSPIDTVQQANRSRVARAAPGLARLARAWATAHRATLPPALAGGDPATELAALFDANGLLDFRELGAGDIPAWLAALGMWPEGMPPTSDPATAGITDAQLREADSVEAAARRARERRRRTVQVGGTDIDVGVGACDFTDLIDALQANLDANPAVIASPRRSAELAPLSSARSRDAGGGQRQGGRDPMAGLSDEQRQATGFAGEWFAYQWLRRQYREANESSWVSTNRHHVFGGEPGDDRLGFDFRVELTRAPIMFEVKANQNEPGVFELTDAEIREARRHARDGRWRLLVVAYVFDPDRCHIMRLPNPFDPRFEGRFRAEDRGIRYRYRLAL